VRVILKKEAGPTPWVRIESRNEPEQMFVGENEAYEQSAKKYDITIEEVKRMINMDAWQEARKIYKINDETKEYKEWRKQNKILKEKAKSLLDEFYKDREVRKDIKLRIENNPEGDFEIHNGKYAYEYIKNEDEYDPEKLSLKRREKIENQLKEYQVEMLAFTEFLKKKYFEH